MQGRWVLSLIVTLAACGSNSQAGDDAGIADAGADAPAPAATISAYGFTVGTNRGLLASVDGSITGTAIAVTVPYGTDVTGLVATFATSSAAVTVGGLPQLSGVTANDFTAPVTYLVDAGGGAMQSYTATVTVAAPTASFDNAASFATGQSAGGTAFADFNGDGTIDLVTTNTDDETVTVLMNTTTPGAAPVTLSPHTFAVGNQPLGVATGDLNGDGRPDIVVAAYAGDRLTILLDTTAPGATTPTFTRTDVVLETSSAEHRQPIQVAIGDLNGNGVPDLAIATSTGVSVLLNLTASGATVPTFAPRLDLVFADGVLAVALGDFDLDGRPDLAIAADTLAVLINTTDPGATTPSFAAPLALDPTGVDMIRVADFNGDGVPDLAMSVLGSTDISVMLDLTTPGQAGLLFSTAATFTDAVGAPVTTFAIADVNGDGHPDVVASGGLTGLSVILDVTRPGAATPAFASAIPVDTGFRTTAVTAVDLNGDGKPEVAATDLDTSMIEVLANTTAWGHALVYAPHVEFPTGSEPNAVAVGDLDADGKLDLAVVNYDDDTLSILLGRTLPGATTPSFAAQVPFATQEFPNAVALGDLNGDGRPDVVVTNGGSASISIFMNTTPQSADTPTFATRADFATLTGPGAIVIGDFNGDGKLDLAVANSFAGSISVFYNTTTPGALVPTFVARRDVDVILDPLGLASGDFNGDGGVDFAAASGTADGVAILLDSAAPGATTPSFEPEVDFHTPLLGSVAIGDLNGDGRPDVAAVDRNEVSVSVLLDTTPVGATTPTFSTHAEFSTNASPAWVSIGDLDGDGRPDLAVANTSSETVSLLRNTTAPGAAAPTFASNVDLPIAGFGYDVVLRDLNGDGKLDLITVAGTANAVSVVLAR